jgi:hypothetical protein
MLNVQSGMKLALKDHLLHAFNVMLIAPGDILA